MAKPLLTFCSKAIQQLKIISTTNGSRPLLIGVKGGGCNGFKYFIEPTVVEESAKNETMIVDGVNIVVCEKSLFYLIGTEVTWKKDLMGERFDFINPNASGTCGCGETFSM